MYAAALLLAWLALAVAALVSLLKLADRVARRRSLTSGDRCSAVRGSGIGIDRRIVGSRRRMVRLLEGNADRRLGGLRSQSFQDISRKVFFVLSNGDYAAIAILFVILIVGLFTRYFDYAITLIVSGLWILAATPAWQICVLLFKAERLGDAEHRRQVLWRVFWLSVIAIALWLAVPHLPEGV